MPPSFNTFSTLKSVQSEVSPWWYGNNYKFVSSAPHRLVSVLAMGEGFHNYHHTFPYDYSTSEWGLRLNMTTCFINAMAKLGLASDLRTASPSVVAARAARTGHPELTRWFKLSSSSFTKLLSSSSIPGKGWHQRKQARRQLLLDRLLNCYNKFILI